MIATVRRRKTRSSLEICSCSVCKNCNFNPISDEGLCTACKSGIHKKDQ